MPTRIYTQNMPGSAALRDINSIGRGVLADVFEHAGYYTVAQVRAADLDAETENNILRKLQRAIDVLKERDDVRVRDWFRISRAAYNAILGIQQADVLCLEVPPPFQCPITGTWMEDPVITPSGTTYERVALTRWLRINATDPHTRQPMGEEHMVPNRALREAIEIYRPLEERFVISRS